MEAKLASTPFAGDPDCLALALRIIKEGVPDFSATQMQKVMKSPGGAEDWLKLEQCKKIQIEAMKAKTGLDFGCFVKQFIPNEFDSLTQCWQAHRDRNICRKQIFEACDALHSQWSRILLHGVYTP